MILKRDIEILEEYKGKSKFEFWHNLKVGDIVTIYMNLKPTGSNRGRIYAPDVYAKNDREGVFGTSINSFQGYLSQIKYKEL
jgi:hypothetical protein